MFELPLLNTALLLASGATVTYSHHGLINGNREAAVLGGIFTVILAVLFTGFQGVEYIVSSFTISDGAFGSCCAPKGQCKDGIPKYLFKNDLGNVGDSSSSQVEHRKLPPAIILIINRHGIAGGKRDFKAILFKARHIASGI